MSLWVGNLNSLRISLRNQSNFEFCHHSMPLDREVEGFPGVAEGWPPMYIMHLLLLVLTGKIDVGRYPEVGEKHFINTTALTRQLPTLILFQDEQEVSVLFFSSRYVLLLSYRLLLGFQIGRVPAIIGGKVQKFQFKEDDIVNVFDLNNLYAECKKDKKYSAQIKLQEQEGDDESKKDK